MAIETSAGSCPGWILSDRHARRRHAKLAIFVSSGRGLPSPSGLTAVEIKVIKSASELHRGLDCVGCCSELPKDNDELRPFSIRRVVK